MCKCSSWLGAFVSKLFKEQRCFSAKKMVALQAGTFIVLSRHMAACPLAQKCLLPTACHLASGPCLGNPGCIRHGPSIAHALQTHWSKIKIHTRQRRWWHCRLALIVFFEAHGCLPIGPKLFTTLVVQPGNLPKPVHLPSSSIQGSRYSQDLRHPRYSKICEVTERNSNDSKWFQLP